MRGPQPAASLGLCGRATGVATISGLLLPYTTPLTFLGTESPGRALGLKTVTCRVPTQEGAAGQERNARPPSPERSPAPRGRLPASSLARVPVSLRPWGPPALPRVPLLPDPALCLRYFSASRLPDWPLRRRAPELALPRGDPAKGRAGPELIIARAGAGPRPLCRQHHLSRSETSGKAPSGTRLQAAWRGGAGRGRAGAPGGERASASCRLAREAEPDPPPASARAAGEVPAWRLGRRGEGKGFAEGAEPQFGRPPLFPGARFGGVTSPFLDSLVPGRPFSRAERGPVASPTRASLSSRALYRPILRLRTSLAAWPLFLQR